MAQKIVWDSAGSHLYENGIDHCVLYPIAANGTYPKGIPWNGLTAITESPSGAEAKALYADNIKYLNLVAAEDFGATIEAYTYPKEFALCDGTAEPVPGVLIGQQARSLFGLCYRTVMGNDVDGMSHGYKLHLIYNAQAAPSERAYSTINDSPDAITFSWQIATTPIVVTGYKPTASLVIDSTLVNAANLADLLEILYGTAAVVDPATPAVEGRMPLPDEVISILTSGS